MERLFTGLEIPDDVAGQIALLRGGIAGARWLEPESYHLTLRFIGDVERPLAEEVARALETVRAAPFEVALSGIGHFGSKRPHALYAGVKTNPALEALQRANERACQAAGLAPEGRRFTPHVTIARLKRAAAGDAQRYEADHSLWALAPFRVERFVLYSSRPSRGGGPYAIERSYDLRGD